MTREIKTILIVLLSGFLAIGGLFAYEVLAEENTSREEVETSESDEESSVHNDIEDEIDALKNYAFKPESYSILMTKINAFYVNGSFTESIKKSLENRLMEVYSQQVYTETEKFLKGRNQNSSEVRSLLAQIKENGGDPQKINYYQDQIYYHHYYSSTLPQKVAAFIEKGITNYSEEEYDQFKEEINNMPNLDSKYKTRKFEQIQKNLLYNLGEFNMAYHIPTYKPEYENI